MPAVNYLAVRGKGNPNQVDGEYQQSIELLYSVAYKLKMSYRSDYQIEGFFQYVVPPLEGFWWIDDLHGMDVTRKEELNFISLLRLPDFIHEKDVQWVRTEVEKKKKKDYSKVEFYRYDEGLCVQCMHIGSYDSEGETTEKMAFFAGEIGYDLDINDIRFHHEIYISDPRKTALDKLKIVLRHPIKLKDSTDKH
ncbi:GyrI-like domain-containing protein [Enterococcus olivae]